MVTYGMYMLQPLYVVIMNWPMLSFFNKFQFSYVVKLQKHIDLESVYYHCDRKLLLHLHSEFMFVAF